MVNLFIYEVICIVFYYVWFIFGNKTLISFYKKGYAIVCIVFILHVCWLIPYNYTFKRVYCFRERGCISVMVPFHNCYSPCLLVQIFKYSFFKSKAAVELSPFLSHTVPLLLSRGTKISLGLQWFKFFETNVFFQTLYSDLNLTSFFVCNSWICYFCSILHVILPVNISYQFALVPFQNNYLHVCRHYYWKFHRFQF